MALALFPALCAVSFAAEPVIIIPEMPSALAFPPGETVGYAAEFLRFHIEAATGKKLEIIPESEAERHPARIWIGNTRFAAKNLKEISFHPEELLIRSLGNDLILCGETTADGLDRGTLFADLNVKRNDGVTPLVLALRKNAMRDFLTASGVDLETDVMDKGMKILHFAIENFRDGEPVRYLLDKGANPDSTDMFNDTPLHYAARRRNLAAAQALLAKNADPNRQNKKGETPIFLAAGRGDAAIVDLLLKNGAKPDIKNKKGQSVLDYAGGDTRKLLQEAAQQ